MKRTHTKRQQRQQRAEELARARFALFAVDWFRGGGHRPPRTRATREMELVCGGHVHVLRLRVDGTVWPLSHPPGVVAEVLSRLAHEPSTCAIWVETIRLNFQMYWDFMGEGRQFSEVMRFIVDSRDRAIVRCGQVFD
jgi:hypothetical protein